MAHAYAALQRMGQWLLRAQGFRSREARTAGGRRFFIYERSGSGRGPPAILVHGLGGAATSFSSIAKAMCKLCKRVILIDLPGHGRAEAGSGKAESSSEKTEPANAMELAQALMALVDEVGEPSLLIGNSLGGALVLGVALMMPKRVAGVVGLAPAGAPFSEEEALQVRTTFRGGPESGGELGRRLFRTPPWPVRLVGRGLGEHIGGPSVQHIVRHIHAGEQGLTAEQLRALPMPALVIWADSDRVLPPSGAEFFRSALPPGSFEMLERCGHLPQIERARWVVRRLTKFVEQLSPPKALGAGDAGRA